MHSRCSSGTTSGCGASSLASMTPSDVDDDARMADIQARIFTELEVTPIL